MIIKEYTEGYDDYFKELKIENCPYLENPKKEEWECGWLSAWNDDLQAEYFNYDWKQMI